VTWRSFLTAADKKTQQIDCDNWMNAGSGGREPRIRGATARIAGRRSQR
jgi:hypothetical protein